jgi:hypothetical protein
VWTTYHEPGRVQGSSTSGSSSTASAASASASPSLLGVVGRLLGCIVVSGVVDRNFVGCILVGCILVGCIVVSCRIGVAEVGVTGRQQLGGVDGLFGLDVDGLIGLDDQVARRQQIGGGGLTRLVGLGVDARWHRRLDRLGLVLTHT